MRLATEVASRVKLAYPKVAVEVIPTTDVYHGTLMSFVPLRPDGAPIWLYANFDWSFDLESDGLMISEMIPFGDSEDEQVDRIVSEISRIAEEGIPVRQGWFGRALGSRSRKRAPWAQPHSPQGESPQ